MLGNSLVHRLERTLACMLEGRVVGVGVAQVVEEVWRGRARSGDVVPSVLGLEDERKVEDTLVQLYIKEETKCIISLLGVATKKQMEKHADKERTSKLT